MKFCVSQSFPLAQNPKDLRVANSTTFTHSDLTAVRCIKRSIEFREATQAARAGTTTLTRWEKVMLMGLTQDTASDNQILAGLSREKYPDLFSNLRPVSLDAGKALIFSRHGLFSVMQLNERRSEFSFGVRR